MGDYLLTARRGDTFKLQVSYLDSNDQIVNVTGYEATFTIWQSATQVFKASTATGEIVASASGYAVKVDETKTELWPENCWYEFRERDPAGDVSTLLDGPLHVEATVRSGVFVV